MSDYSAIFLPQEVSQKMSMGAKDPNACKISMLWNWYTINSCFLSRSWHVKSRGMFAGTCIGVFFWVMAYCWFHRFIVEYDNAIVEYRTKQYLNLNAGSEDGCCCVESNKEKGDSSSSSDDSEIVQTAPGKDLWTPLIKTFSHKWYLAWTKKTPGVIYPSPAEHIGRSGLYLMEWTVSYLIMLMWMYYNGYIVITMILGYFFGQLFFNYTPLTVINAIEKTAAPSHPDSTLN